MCYFCGRMRRIFKKHGTIVKNALLISIVSLVVWACTVDDMRLSYQHTVQFGIYSTNTKADTTLTNFSARGFGKDSLLYDKEASVTQIFLNANLNADSVSYLVQTESLVDTISFWYTLSLSPVSGSGGVTSEVHVDSVWCSNAFIDSVSLVYPNVKYNESKENVQIYIF